MRFLVFIIILILTSCSYRHVKESESFVSTGSQGINTLDAGGDVYFASVQKNIILPRCAKCHSDSGGNQGGVNLENYDDVTKHLNGINQRSLIEKNMPPGKPLNSDELNILGNWIAKGAPLDSQNSKGSNSNTPSKPTVVWSKIKNEIFASHCLQCHSPPPTDPNADTVSTMEAGLNLTDYEMVKSKADLILKRVIIANDMPLSPYPKLSTYEKKVLTDWMISGMFNDEIIEENKTDGNEGENK
jgi:uncharacterized membrane protein